MSKAWVSLKIKHDILGRELPESVPTPRSPWPAPWQKPQTLTHRPFPGPVPPPPKAEPPAAAVSQTACDGDPTTRPKPAWACKMDESELRKLPPAPPPEKPAWGAVSGNHNFNTLPSASLAQSQVPPRQALQKDNRGSAEVSSPSVPVPRHAVDANSEWVTVNRSAIKKPHAPKSQPPPPTNAAVKFRPSTSASTPEKKPSFIPRHKRVQPVIIPVKEGKLKKQRTTRPLPAVPAWLSQLDSDCPSEDVNFPDTSPTEVVKTTVDAHIPTTLPQPSAPKFKDTQPKLRPTIEWILDPNNTGYQPIPHDSSPKIAAFDSEEVHKRDDGYASGVPEMQEKMQHLLDSAPPDIDFPLLVPDNSSINYSNRPSSEADSKRQTSSNISSRTSSFSAWDSERILSLTAGTSFTTSEHDFSPSSSNFGSPILGSLKAIYNCNPTSHMHPIPPPHAIEPEIQQPTKPRSNPTEAEMEDCLMDYYFGPDGAQLDLNNLPSTYDEFHDILDFQDHMYYRKYDKLLNTRNTARWRSRITVGKEWPLHSAYKTEQVPFGGVYPGIFSYLLCSKQRLTGNMKVVDYYCDVPDVHLGYDGL